MSTSNITVEELEIIMLESAYERSKEYEMRCERRYYEAKETYLQAEEKTLKAYGDLELKRQEWLRRTV